MIRKRKEVKLTQRQLQPNKDQRICKSSKKNNKEKENKDKHNKKGSENKKRKEKENNKRKKIEKLNNSKIEKRIYKARVFISQKNNNKKQIG